MFAVTRTEIKQKTRIDTIKKIRPKKKPSNNSQVPIKTATARAFSFHSGVKFDNDCNLVYKQSSLSGLFYSTSFSLSSHSEFILHRKLLSIWSWSPASIAWQLTDGWMVFSFIHSIALAKVNWTIGNLHVYIRMIYHIYFCSRSSAVGKALHHESIKGSVNLVLELFEENQPIRPQIVCQLWQVDFFQLNSIKRSYNSDRLLLWIQKVPFPNFGALFS